MTQVPTPMDEREAAIAVLADAQTGLRWYQAEYPEYASEADNELHARIDRVLALLRRDAPREGASVPSDSRWLVISYTTNEPATVTGCVNTEEVREAVERAMFGTNEAAPCKEVDEVMDGFSDPDEWAGCRFSYSFEDGGLLIVRVAPDRAPREGGDGIALLNAMLTHGCSQQAMSAVGTFIGLAQEPDKMHPRDVVDAVAYLSHRPQPAGEAWPAPGWLAGKLAALDAAGIEEPGVIGAGLPPDAPLDAVGALPAKWRAEHGGSRHKRECADELAAALGSQAGVDEAKPRWPTFEAWLDRDWPLWRNNPSNPLVARMRNAWHAALSRTQEPQS